MGLKADRIYSILKERGVKRRTAAERLMLLPLSFNFKNSLSQDEKVLFIAGSMLYMGEGAKTGNTVDFANSDPRTLQLFVKYLRRIFGIDERKLRLYLYCHSNQNILILKTFWSSLLDIEPDKFTRPYIKNAGSDKKRLMPWGLLHIRYNDKRLLEKILSLCSDLMVELIENQAD